MKNVVETRTRDDEATAIEAVRALVAPEDNARLEELMEANAPKDWKALDWMDDMDAALAKAKAENKPVLADFTTSWCGWCRVMEKETFSNPGIWKQMHDRVVLVSVDGDKERDLVKKYGVKGYPTLALLNGEGEVIVLKAGYKPPTDFQTEILDKIP